MTQRITGRTRLAGVIGTPLEHTLSPAMHNAVYEALDLNWVYVPLPLDDETDLIRFLGAARVLPFQGFNVTMPFKHAMLQHCDEVAMLAQMAGAVNTVHCVDGRLIGYNTDGRGLIEALAENLDFDPVDKSVIVLGAGGASGAAVVAFILAKAAKITVANRTLDRAVQLVERVSAHARNTALSAVELSCAGEAVSSADLIVNCTPVGMVAGDPSPVPAAWLRPGQLVFDMVYGGAPTQLLVDARALGAQAVDGVGMLVAQAAIAVDIWSESAQIRTPRNIMRAAADAVLLERMGEGADR